MRIATIIRVNIRAGDGGQTASIPKLVLIALLLGIAVAGIAQAEEIEVPKKAPSRAFLEFLLDFSETDDESFEMLVENGQKDIRQKLDPNIDDSTTAAAQKEPEATP